MRVQLEAASESRAEAEGEAHEAKKKLAALEVELDDHKRSSAEAAEQIKALEISLRKERERAGGAAELLD